MLQLHTISWRFSPYPIHSLMRCPLAIGLCRLGRHHPCRGLCASILRQLPGARLIAYLRKRHHKEDVVVGSVIGIFSGAICYLLYWPNPFSASSFSAETIGRPRLSAINDVEGYRLAPEGPVSESV